MNIIVIDCGASFLKGAKLDGTTGEIIKQVQKSSPTVHRDEPITDTVQIDALSSAIIDMISELRGEDKEVAFGLSTEMHGFLLAFEDGRAYTDYISWQKEYGKLKIGEKSAFEQLSVPEYADDIKKSGMPLRAGLPSCNMLYLKDTGLLSIEDNLVFYTLGDYLVKRVFGVEICIHPTNAAASGLMDITSGKWNHRLFQKVATDKIRLPEIGETSTICEYQGCLFHLFPALGDQQAALYGAGIREKDSLSFNLGTGAQTSVIVDGAELSEGMQTRPYIDGKYLRTIPHLPSGRALNVYVRFLEDVLDRFGLNPDSNDIWDVMLKAASEDSEHSLECDMSFFENPITDHTCGKISEIGEYGLTLNNLMGSIFDQMIANFLWAAERVQPDKTKVTKLIFSGGIARRIKPIRDGIIKAYDGIDVEIAENETQSGVYAYIKKELK
ncbi:sedoheptulokinase [Butyrivibrio sp. MB2005]|uniref:sedoheptulokinase n=1 Tax=Butyrivibrio sp. MB2005 TaxID=1280678 RepID=UPI00040F02EF|nr:FGGY family carbohydrate kinase [Butyrivibrio sp. MB2005]